jgi:hypothetical protein
MLWHWVVNHMYTENYDIYLSRNFFNPSFKIAIWPRTEGFLYWLTRRIFWYAWNFCSNQKSMQVKYNINTTHLKWLGTNHQTKRWTQPYFPFSALQYLWNINILSNPTKWGNLKQYFVIELSAIWITYANIRLIIYLIYMSLNVNITKNYSPKRT